MAFKLIRVAVLGCLAEATSLSEAAVNSDESCEEECAPGQQLLQVSAVVHNEGSEGQRADFFTELQFIHIPCTFGHTVEEAGLGYIPDPSQAMLGTRITADASKGQMLWGEFVPALNGKAEATKCDLFYTPPKYWSADLQQRMFANKTAFAMLRDPYDRMANEFRMQAGGIDSAWTLTSREMVSQREGNLERESEQYKQFYETCDVNGYLQAELQKYLDGDRFRDNCHLLPSSEYFEFGHVLAVDERKIPDSFNAFMIGQGAAARMTESIHNIWCNDISAYSLNEKTKELIRKVFANDFKLQCERFGYCDDHELYCHENIPDMCGGKP